MSKYPGIDEQLAGSIDIAIVEFARVVREQRQSCLTCIHFNEQAESCAKANGARPPARVIALGCPMHEHEIPF